MYIYHAFSHNNPSVVLPLEISNFLCNLDVEAVGGNAAAVLLSLILVSDRLLRLYPDH